MRGAAAITACERGYDHGESPVSRNDRPISDQQRRRFLGAMAGVGAGWLLPGLPAAFAAGRAAVENLRMSANDEQTRLVFDLGDHVEHSLFTLSDPDRIVIDLANTKAGDVLPSSRSGGGLIKRIRSARRGDGDLRVVLDLERPGRARSFMLRPSDGRGHRLVVDIDIGDGPASIAEIQDDERRARDLIIAIDPGHGGRDPGAIGPSGTMEKNIALQVSERLVAEFNRTDGFKPVIARRDDRFLSLRDRVRFARDSDADLFLSIHADAFHDQRARGSSVFALSTNGASSEAARWMASRENSADFIGGISMKNRDEEVASVLLDLSQTASIESSLDVGEEILGRLGNINRLHSSTVQQAGFVVLKSPDVPSLLVETAFISNPEEERKLRDATHQANLARAIRLGAEHYFERKAPPGTVISERRRSSVG